MQDCYIRSGGENNCAVDLPSRPGDTRLSNLQQSILPKDPQQLTNRELVSRCADRSDEVAWLEFVRRFQPVIAIVASRTARRWTNVSFTLVDDLVQLTYLNLCSNRCKALRELVWRHENCIYGFLKVVAANTTQDYFRSRFCRKRYCNRIEESVETSTVASKLAAPRAHQGERRVLIDQIERSLRSIVSGPNSERDLTIFWLYYREGLTAIEISEFLGIDLSIKGVESIVHRLSCLLKRKLKPNVGGAVA